MIHPLRALVAMLLAVLLTGVATGSCGLSPHSAAAGPVLEKLEQTFGTRVD